MIIKSVAYRSFRNIENEYIEPSRGVNVIFGENAQGKTNLLEGIWMFSGFRSFRAAHDGELIRFGDGFSSLTAVYDDGRRENTAEMKITNKRSVRLNGVGMKSPAEMIGRFNTVLFAPEFMTIVKNSPADRRNFIDTAICRLYPSGGALMSEYDRLLKQRNALIKDRENIDYDLLDCLDFQLSETGGKLVKLRRRYTQIIKEPVAEIYRGISSGREEIGLEYVARHNEDDADTIENLLRKNREKDILTGMTCVGPHRDDLEIKINGISAKMYGSQGQQRSCAVALKLGESEVIAEKTGIKPVVLLDDVMSELDVSRQDYILNHIGDRQVFITCCEPDTVRRLGDGIRLEVKNGGVVKRV